MSRTPSLRRRLLVAFAGAMLLLGAMGAAARAESYGEPGHCQASPRSLRWLGARLAFGGPQRFKEWRLPRRRLADLALGAFQDPRELAGGDRPAAQLLEEGGLQRKISGGESEGECVG
jgi:hypothetical protein